MIELYEHVFNEIEDAFFLVEFRVNPYQNFEYLINLWKNWIIKRIVYVNQQFIWKLIEKNETSKQDLDFASEV